MRAFFLKTRWFCFDLDFWQPADSSRLFWLDRRDVVKTLRSARESRSQPFKSAPDMAGHGKGLSSAKTGYHVPIPAPEESDLA